ncbi:hypothetical protein [Microtetraspora glauca]|uniref:DUF4365 domain-containing protein n=1 Tax=Microtetraspora glauca TaxID=1996 RepID=A0ABV3GFT4_MICGL
MLTSEHEVIVRLFHERPVLAAELLTETLKIPLPDYDHAAVESGDLTEVTPTELRADSVIVFRKKQSDADPEPVLAVVMEVQRGRDNGKRWSWPMYLISLRTRMRCPAILLVVCPDAAIAHWSRHPIELGHPGLTLTPLVAGPTEVPMILDPCDAAEDPELAVLSVITHANTPQGPDILNALLKAVHDLDPYKGGRYADMVRAALPREIWEHLEKLMKTETYEYLSEWARNNIAEGKAEGKAESILQVLSARDLEVPDDVRAEIGACTDIDQLDAWIRAAVAVESARDLLDI